MKSSKRNQAGFTLIELALIIAVLGILGAVGAVKLADLTTEANKAAEDTALANARSALAIGIAKESDNKVTLAELTSTYLTGAVASGTDKLVVEGKYTFDVTLQDGGIVAITKQPVTP